MKKSEKVEKVEVDKIKLPENTKATLINIQREITSLSRSMNLILATAVQMACGDTDDEYKTLDDFSYLIRAPKEESK